MESMHSIEGLVRIIKSAYGQSELYDVNLNFRKKDPHCPDSITHYLSGFQTDNSLHSRVQFHNLLGAVTYDATVFCYLKERNQRIIHQFPLGNFYSNELYSRLENADFFEKTDMFAIAFLMSNDPFSTVPEVYIYITE